MSKVTLPHLVSTFIKLIWLQGYLYLPDKLLIFMNKNESEKMVYIGFQYVPLDCCNVIHVSFRVPVANSS